MKIQFEFETPEMEMDAVDGLNDNSEIRDCLAAYLCAMLCMKQKKIFNASVVPIHKGYYNSDDSAEEILPIYAELA